MPLPKPETRERYRPWIQRCMGEDVMVREYDDPQQRRAVCESQWARRKPRTFSRALLLTRGRQERRRRARSHTLEADHVADKGMEAFRRVVARLHRALLATVSRRGSIDSALGKFEPAFAELMAKGMAAGHLSGRIRVVQDFEERIHKSPRFGAYDDALRVMQQRLNFTTDQVVAITQSYGDAAVNVTRGLGGVAERAAREASETIVREGMHAREGIAEMSKRLSAAGVGTVKPHLAETLVRTQTHLAYSAGRYNALQDPAIDEIVWGYEYVTVGDDRVRDEHAPLDGVILPKDDPTWQAIWPPNGFNCRCDVLEVFTDDQPTIKPVPQPDEDGVAPGADAGWGFNPGVAHADALPTRSTVGPSPGPPTVDARTMALEEGEQAVNAQIEDLTKQMSEAGKIHAADVKKIERRIENVTAQMEEVSQRTTALFNQRHDLPIASRRTPKEQKIAEMIKAKLDAEHEAFNRLIQRQADLGGQFQSLKQAQKEAVIRTLAVDDPVRFKLDYQSKVFRGKRKGHIEDGLRAFANLATKPDDLGDARIVIRAQRARRSAAGSQAMFMSKSARTWTTVHELGHVLEGKSKHVHQRCVEFLQKRTKGAKLEQLRKMDPSLRYTRDEMAREGKFIRKYTGKQYEWGGDTYATEILSMGAQHLYEDPLWFAATDYDHFRFTVAVLRGAL